MGRRKNVTLKKRVTFVIVFFSSLILLSVLLAQAYSLLSLNRQTVETYGVLAEELGESLDSTLKDLEEYCRNITYTSWFYKSLLSSSASSSFRVQAEYELMQMMKNKVISSEIIHSLNVINPTEERIYSVMKTPDTDFMYELKKRVIKEDLHFGDAWMLYDYEGVSYCGRAFYNGKFITVVFVDLRDFDLSGSPSRLASERTLLTYIAGDRFLIHQDRISEIGLDVNDITTKGHLLLSPYYVFDYETRIPDVTAALIIDRNEMIHRHRILVVLVFINVVLEFVLIFWMSGQMKKAVLDPVRRIVGKIEDIRSGRQDVRDLVEQKKSSEEYRIIDDAINELVKETGELEERYYRKAMEKDHAELQYYQLQTEPHFFLNCLKNINMLLELEEYEKAQKMILAFSQHIRYVFKDNAKTVSLRSEVEEAEAYFNICQLRTARLILLEKEIPEALLEFQVPLLSVQAFVENAIKYAYQEGAVLVIRITADIYPEENSRKVRITISDNGPGYSEEALSKLTEIETGQFISEKTGIRNLLNRMHIIYGDRASYRFYNLEEGGAAAELLLPAEGV